MLHLKRSNTPHRKTGRTGHGRNSIEFSIKRVAVRCKRRFLAEHCFTGQGIAVFVQAKAYAVFILSVSCDVFLAPGNRGFADKIQILYFHPFCHTFVNQQTLAFGAFPEVFIIVPMSVLSYMSKFVGEGSNQRKAGIRKCLLLRKKERKCTQTKNRFIRKNHYIKPLGYGNEKADCTLAS